MKIEICDKCEKRKAKFHARYTVTDEQPFKFYREGIYCRKCMKEIEEKYKADVKHAVQQMGG